MNRKVMGEKEYGVEGGGIGDDDDGGVGDDPRR